MKELKVSAIKDGTVIDHLPSDKMFEVAEILNLNNADQEVLMGTNLFTLSSKCKKKGIIKVSGKILDIEEWDKVALIAPKATVNIIKNYEVIKKIKVKIPETVKGIVRCFNPNCITNNDNVKTMFHIINVKPLKIRCHYCERMMSADDIVIL